MVSQPYKDLIEDGVWARNADALKDTPENLGIDRESGYVEAYEQVGSGKTPELEGFNQALHDIYSGLVDVAAMGVPAWDAELNYRPTADAACFATTATGLWVTFMDTGPDFGNATDPETANQQVWRRY